MSFSINDLLGLLLQNTDFVLLLQAVVLFFSACLCRRLSFSGCTLHWKWLSVALFAASFGLVVTVVALGVEDQRTLTTLHHLSSFATAVATLLFSVGSLSAARGGRVLRRFLLPALVAVLLARFSAVRDSGQVFRLLAETLAWPALVLAFCALWHHGGGYHDTRRETLRSLAVCLLPEILSRVLLPNGYALYFQANYDPESSPLVGAIPFLLVKTVVIIFAFAMLQRYLGQTCAAQKREFRGLPTPKHAVLLLILFAMLGWLAVNWRTDSHAVTQVRHLVHLSSSVAQTILPQHAKALTFTADDIDNPVFRRLRNELMTFAAATQVKGIYTLKPDAGKLICGPDSYALTSPEFSFPGSIHGTASFALREKMPFSDPFVVGPYHDAFGTFVSGCSAVKDPATGEVLMFVVVDVDGAAWMRTHYRVRRLPLSALLVLYLICLLGFATLEHRDACARKRTGPLLYAEPGIISLIGILTTVTVSWLLHESNQAWIRHHLALASQPFALHVQTTLEENRHTLRTLANFFTFTVGSRADFSRMAVPLLADANSRSFRYIPVVQPEQADNYREWANADGCPNFHWKIWNDKALAVDSINRIPETTFFPIFYIEPSPLTHHLLGFDLGSDPVRRRAILETIRTGLLSAARPIDPSAPGTGRYLEFYYPITPANAGSDEDISVSGVVCMSMTFDDLFHTAANRFGRSIKMINTHFSAITLNGFAPVLAKFPADYVVQTVIIPNQTFADAGSCIYPLFTLGHVFGLVVTPSASFAQMHSTYNVHAVATCGIVVTLLLAVATRLILNREQSVSQAIRRRTSEIEQSRESLAATLNTAAVGILVINPSGRIVRINPAAETLIGRAASEVLHKPIDEAFTLLRTETREPAADSLRQALSATYARSGTAAEGGLTLIGVDGRTRQVIRLASPIYNRQNNLAGAVIVLSDISRMLHVQKLESLTTMAGGIAHDFNNLLTVIQANLEMVAEKLPPGSDSCGAAHDALTATNRAIRISHKMLAYSGRTALARVAVSLNDIVNSVLPKFQATQVQTVMFDLHLSPDLPFIQGDQTALLQICNNLIQNAVEAIGDKHGRLTLSTAVVTCSSADLRQAYCQTVPDAGRFVQLTVSDTGHGLNATAKSHLFEPFFSTRFTGRGLGLAVVHGFVSAHGGAIFVQSAETSGTTIRVLFPCEAS